MLFGVCRTISELLTKLAAHELARAGGVQSTLTGLGALNNMSRILDEQLKASFSATIIPRRTDSLSPRPPSASGSLTSARSPSPAPLPRPPSVASLAPLPRRASTVPGSSRPVSLVENPEMAARLAQAEMEMKAILGKVADDGELARPALDPIERPSSLKLRPQTPTIRLSSHEEHPSPRPVNDFQRNVVDILGSLNSTNLASIPDVIAFWVSHSSPDRAGPSLHDLTVAIVDKATEELSHAWLYAELCSKLMSRISLPLSRRNSAKLDGGMETGGDLARGGALFRQYLADRLTDAADAVTRQQAVWKFVEELLGREALTEGLLHRAIERLLLRAHVFKDDEAKSLYRLLTLFGRSIKTPKALHQMTDYCKRLDATRDNEDLSALVCTLLLSTKGFLRRSTVAEA